MNEVIEAVRVGGPCTDEELRYAVRNLSITAVSLLESYDYLLCGQITTEEAIRRLRLLRAGRAALAEASPTPMKERTEG